jgi:5'-nucleotidase
MRTIIVTNDDGIHSPGLEALADSVRDLGRVIVVAPDRDNSAVSHSLTMTRPLQLNRIEKDIYTLDGTPTDCVILALGKILDKKPDLLVSGINNGPNLGDDISYSGTVSAAMEGTMYGVASMAVSVSGDEPLDYSAAQTLAHKLAITIMENELPNKTLINLNVPSGSKYRGIKVTRQGQRLWENAIKETQDPWGRPRYWIGGGTPVKDERRDTDVKAIHEGYASVTPIHLDLTNHASIQCLKEKWRLEE